MTHKEAIQILKSIDEYDRGWANGQKRIISDLFREFSRYECYKIALDYLKDYCEKNNISINK